MRTLAATLIRSAAERGRRTPLLTSKLDKQTSSVHTAHRCLQEHNDVAENSLLTSQCLHTVFRPLAVGDRGGAMFASLAEAVEKFRAILSSAFGDKNSQCAYF